MSKRAEQAASEAYPIPQGTTPSGRPWNDYDMNLLREPFIKGYEQAEKVLALTWEDIKAVVETADMMVSEVGRSSQELIQKYPTEKAYYTEVLNRFNKSKEKK